MSESMNDNNLYHALATRSRPTASTPPATGHGARRQ